MIRLWLAQWLTRLLALDDLRARVEGIEKRLNNAAAIVARMDAVQAPTSSRPTTKKKKTSRIAMTDFAAWPRQVLDQVDWDRMGIEPPEDER